MTAQERKFRNLYAVVAELGVDLDEETCFCCGEPVAYGFDGDPTHHRGMCKDCDAVRCDAYPLDCLRKE